MKQIETERMKPGNAETNPVEGTVYWNPVKSIWYSFHALVAVVTVPFFFDWKAASVCGALTVVTLCCGHSVGLHRLLIHRSWKAPLWLEHLLVYLGTLVGMGGPFGMIRLHDIRDWSQRHDACHPFFIHKAGIVRDWFWNLHCGIRLTYPPQFTIEEEVANDRFYRFLQRTWMAQQLPLAILLFFAGGWTWVAWGISVRIFLSLSGHWLIGHFAHNSGDRDWHLHNNAVQGYNLRHLGLLTMGESWHNNHHAYPESARLGFTGAQADPGWMFIRCLIWVGLASEVKTPENLPFRKEREWIASPRKPGRNLVTGVE